RLVLSRPQHSAAACRRNGAALLFHVALRRQWRCLCFLSCDLGGLALDHHRPPLVSRRLAGDAARSPSAERAAAAGSVQWRAAYRLHRRNRNGDGSVVTGLAIYKPAQLSWLAG